MSSVVSTGSVSGELPSSENIIRESLGVSNVRNKWRNIENKSMSDFRNASPSPRRTNSFTVTPAAAYRSSSVPKSPMRDPVSPSYVKAEAERLPTSPTAVPVNSPRYSRIIPGESFIDREIRESAEREEQWKHEKQDSDIDRLSVTSQSDSLSGNTKFHTDVNYTPVNSMTYNDVTKESPRS
uniref:Uncharacterized protein n=1 Tax=Ciona savignyi TaxID=51511 RepID=H2YM09_CIOSA